ncbi:MAG TPA: tRNA (N(6)-L-threonylcarbamoyladenosine(37)-C(2))-methylthiotransferase MtaB [Thiotrichaceae bacterium]|jgi:threonylcarbamoyladenosine tRNA methylthiotransferase MtaB|nr:tRNA (N(6)-L-threonylcarbamoyladenosine(37)-C(2))-methylthiotransferase MtaB [Thiotrichaceae bacterium]HIM08512.1 tRNA (N(6)-L-threonylcarbamoyladenosine(37)-C(2))-methylthiotransferase MtaB [Gammaproteobacteria bacterium]
MQINLKTLGCRLNEAELESWAEAFQARGHSLTDNLEQADLLVVNTCAVTQEAVKKSRQLIRRTHRNNPMAKLVVSGCYASLDEKIQKDIPGIDLVINNQKKDQLVDIALKELNFDSMPAISTEPGEASIFKRGRNRAFIKIQDGCRYRCTFCIVTVARGEERSRSEADIIKDINQFHQQGIQEIILTGVHVGGYGSDINLNLYQLINSVLSNTDIPRIRLGSVEPWELPEEFFSLFANDRIMPHMHLPLQSGSDSVLKRMARRCKTNDYKKLIQQARNEIPNFNLTTDIIVGFPGETEEEWQESINFIEETSFSHIHIFTYSKREGTKAATLTNQVDSSIKKQRSKQLHALTKTMRESFLNEQIGQTHSVLWEACNEDNVWKGYTENFIRIELKDSNTSELENKISKVKITGIDDNAEHCIAEFI